MPFILLIPFMIIMLILIIASAVVVMQSIGWLPVFGLTELTFQYYADILTDSEFMSSLSVSLRVSLISTLIAVVLGIAVSSAIIAKRSDKSFPMIVRFPMLVPHAVVAVFMINILSQTGILARIAFALGMIEDYTQFHQFLYTESFAGVIIAYIWKEAPFVAYFVFALMSSVSKTLGEAARNLGASSFGSFFSVTLPLSMPAVLNAAFIIFVFSFGGYELPMLLGATLPKALPVKAFLEFTSPDLLNRPYAMAANGIILFVSVIVALLYLVAMKHVVKRTGGHHE